MMLIKFFRDAFWIGIVSIALQLKGLILIPLLSKKFGPIGYGVWAQVVVLIGMLTPLMGFGIEHGYNRFMPAKNRQEQAHILWTQIWLHTATAVICGLCLFFWAKPIASFLLSSPQDYMLIIICGLAIYASLVINDVRTFFRVGQNVKVLNIVLLGYGFGNLTVVFLTYLAGGGVFEIVAAGTLFDLLLAGSFIFSIACRYGIRGFNKEIAKRFVSFGWVLIPSGYAMWALNFSDRLFLAHYTTLKEIGIYSVMYAVGYGLIPIVVTPFWTMYSVVATEKYNKSDIESVKSLYNYVTKAIMFAVIIGFALLFLFAEDIVVFISSSEFIIGSSIIPIIFLSYVINIFASFYAVTLGLNLKQRIVTISIVTAALVNILLNFILIPIYGIYGAAYSTLISFVVDYIICSYYANKVVKLSLDKIFLAKAILAASIIYIVFGKYFIHINSISDLFFTSLVGFIGYTIICLSLKLLSKDEISALLNIHY